MVYHLAPNGTFTISSVVVTLKERPQGAKLQVARDFNVKLSETEGNRRGEDIAAVLATNGLEDMSAQFLLCRHS